MMELPRSMTAVVNHGAEPKSVSCRELPVPPIGEEDVLLEVRAVGICGSDVHQWMGTHSWPVNYPVTLGHEFSGVIVGTGSRVRSFSRGDRVTSETAAVIDPESPLSRQGRYHLDPARLGFGYGVDGAMARFVRVPERCLHRIPPNVSFERAALTEPCSVAYHAVCLRTRIEPGDQVLVLGPGPIGILCGIMARLSGAGRVLVSGLASDTHRLSVAGRMGLDTVSAGEAVDSVRAAGDGLGAEVVIDAAGVSKSLEAAMEAVRPGGQITKVGWGRAPVGVSLDPIVRKAVTLRGSFSHYWDVWERVLRLLETGQLDVDPLVDGVMPLDAWEDAFERMHGCEYVKIVLRP